MAKKNYEEMSKQILELTGGNNNITQLTHCVTRLRFNVRDKSLVQVKEIENIKGVMGTQWSGEQFQIIIGGEVGEVYKVICQLGGFQEEAGIDENLDADLKKDHSIKGLFLTLMDTISSILAPVIPAIVACGLLQGILYSLQSMNLIDATTDTYTFFYNCSTAAFYFLPVLVAYSAGKRFKCNQVLAATTAAIIMLPAFSAMAGTEIKLFGFLPITCFALAMTTFVSQNIGAKKYDRVKKGTRFGIICSLVLAQIIGMIIFIGAPFLIGLFDSTQDVISYGTMQARTVTLFYFLLAFSHCIAGILRGAGKSMIPMIVMMIFWCVVRVLYISIALHLVHDIHLVFWAYPITWACSSIVFLWFYLFSSWLPRLEKDSL